MKTGFSDKFISKFAALALTAVFAIGSLTLAACAKDADPSDDTDAGSGDGWQTFTYGYADASGGQAEIEYAVYTPESYEEGDSLPLITYIPDSTYVGWTCTAQKRTACLSSWITEEKMSENPAFFLIFSFKTVSTDISEGSEGAQIVPIINKVVEDYGIDEDRLYLTGQSMGGITDFALNAKYPDMFAATVYVGCQPGSEVGDEQYNAIIAAEKFADQKFIYITSRLDGKAPYGQDAVENVLIANGKEYGKLYGLDHTDSAALDAAIREELDKGYTQYFFGFRQLTSTGEESAEHMQSFKYAYAVDAIFDWLLAQ